MCVQISVPCKIKDHYSLISLHKGVGFSIHSLNRTGSLCLLGCHNYGMRWHTSAKRMCVRYTMLATTCYSVSTLLLRVYMGHH